MDISGQNSSPQAAQNQDIGQGRGVYISTYGCQMNVNDTERMYSLMEMANFTPVEKPEDASVIIINSCSVREKPVHKVYSEAGLYRKLKDKNPDLRLGVGGCVGQQEKENLIKNQPMIDFVFGTDNIDALPSIVAQTYEDQTPTQEGFDAPKSKKVVQAKFEHRAPYHVETLVRNPGVATFVNIAKGCDNFCTFCVVPFTRGREKSRPLRHIIDDVKVLVKRGVKEITLLGQNVNSYHSECGADFADLIERVAKETDVLRLRYTTSHPKDFNQKLVDVMYANQPKVCEYIHLPFQSGNSRILQLMNRGYTREEYIEKIAMIKKAIPNVVLSTDIIVGFPGETEEEFQDTVSLVKEIGFETIFAFKYSPRPFTKAANFSDQVDEDVKSDRLQRLFEAHNEMSFELVKVYENQTLDVLVENIEARGGNLFGRSSQNKGVYFSSGFPSGSDQSKQLLGQMVKVKILKAFPNVLRGEMIRQEEVNV